MYRTGKGSGGTPGPTVESGSGFFNYQNTGAVQPIAAATWGTLLNNGAGALTDSRFAPAEVGSMLDPATGRVLLADLKVGDRVHLRHTLSLMGYVNNMRVSFRSFVGQAGQEYELPFGPPVLMSSGAGVPTGLIVLETHFYVRDENTRLGGLLPQAKGDGKFDVEYSSLFVAVSR